MALSVVRLGSPRAKNEGIRIGTVRRPPRGVRKEDYSRLDHFDVWLPQLSPSAELVHMIKSEQFTASRWKAFERRFVRELSSPDNSRILDLLAALSKITNFSIGCYCEAEDRCHRSILRKELQKRNAQFT